MVAGRCRLDVEELPVAVAEQERILGAAARDEHVAVAVAIDVGGPRL